MRFIAGPVPASERPLRAEEGWTPLGESSPGRLTVLALLIGLAFVPVMLWVLDAERAELKSFLRAHPGALVGFTAALVLMVPVHEAIHALAYFQDLRSRRMIGGAWLRKGMCFVLYDAPLPRNRVLLMSAAPFAVLSLLPLAVLPWLSGPPRALVLLFTILHTILCGGDFFTFARLWRQVPRGGWVHNDGWQTYWTGRRPS